MATDSFETLPGSFGQQLTNSTSHRNVLCPEHFYLLASDLSLTLAFMLGTHILLHRRDHQKQILRKL
ncbi:hypothetical protein IAS59_000441 [Cryptococcus gattii]